MMDDLNVGDRLSQAKQFLDAMFAPEDSVAVRPIETWSEQEEGGKPHKRSRVIYRQQCWLTAAKLSTISALNSLDLVSSREQANLFFGVCPRFGGGGQFDLAWQIRTVRCLWADVDGTTVDAVLEKCARAGLPRPSIIVASGHGAHLYWLLIEPVLIDDVGDPPAALTEWIEANGKKKPRKYYLDESGERIYVDAKQGAPGLSPKAQHIQDVVQGIAHKIGGDATHDLSRLLRIPGTLNRKHERNGQQPVPCVLIECDPTRRYPLANFEKYAGASPGQVRRMKIDRVTLPAQKRPSARTKNLLRDLIVACDVAPQGQRSEADFRLCCLAIRKGVASDVLWPQVSQIGRFAEDGPEYFERTWRAAEKCVREETYAKAERKAGVANQSSMINRNADGDVPDLPRIDTGCRDLTIICTQAWDALLAANDPAVIYRFGGLPARIETGDHDDPFVRIINYPRMRYRLARCAHWFRQVPEGDGGFVEKAVGPPKEVVEDMLATPDMPLPVLSRIVEAPVFAADGTLQKEPGYHSAGRIYYAPASGFSVPAVSKSPSAAEMQLAKELICTDLLGDFPFIGDSEKAHAIAGMLLPFARNLINGATPLHLVEKPQAGSGATLLVEMLAYAAIGRSIPIMTEGKDEDEWRKRLTAKLKTSPSFVLIDNLRNTLDSGALSAAITSNRWEDRLLGGSEMAHVPIQCVWLATGNNPNVSNEIARRSIRIRLDAKMQQPWLRDPKDFRHPNLRKWVAENRGQLAWAALTIVQAWFAAGRPLGKEPMGQFENWAQTMGGILQSAEIPGFLGNLKAFYDDADAETREWSGLVSAWWTKYGSSQVGAGDLMALNDTEGFLQLGDKSDQSKRSRLGKMLGKKQGCVFSIEHDGNELQVRIVRGDIKHRANQWSLSECGECW